MKKFVLRCHLKIENRFVKKGEIIIALKDEKNIIADFDGKIGKREIAQGVLGSNSLILTLDDLRKIIIDITAIVCSKVGHDRCQIFSIT